MVLVIALPVQPMYNIWRGKVNTPMVEETFRPFSLDWLGIVLGNYWDYTISGILWGNGTERDSVFLVGTLSGLPYCPFYSFPGANYEIRRNTDSTGLEIETGFIYFRSGYDDLYGDGGLMVMKYSPSVGNIWQAWDTCLLRLNVRFSIGDVDGDGIDDSVWVSSSNAVVQSVSSGNYTIDISPLRYAAWSSLLSSIYNVDSIQIWDYYRFKFVENFGKIEEHLDSERIRYFIFGIPVLDTTFRDMYHKVITTSVREISRGFDGKGAVYSVDGRYLGRDLPRKKGTYFIVSGSRLRKVIIR